MKISAPFLQNLFDYASHRNIDSDELKNLTANPNIDFWNSEESVDSEDYLRVFERITDSMKSDYSGLSLGAYLNLSSLGLVLDISLNTSSLKQGIKILENYLKSKFPIVSFKIIHGSESQSLQLGSCVKNQKVKRQLLNMVLLIIYRELKLMLPKEFSPKVALPFSENEDITLFWKSDVFNSTKHQVLLPRNLYELEINDNRIRDIELLLPRFISMLNQNGNSNKFSDKVRSMALNMCNPEIPNLNQVQSQFAYGERTFQRKLKAERSSFRLIINEIKKELSHYLSYEKHLKTKDIAYILGYSDSSAYLHAAKKWRKEK